MDVLIVATELAPYAEATTTAEVVASIAKVERQQGHEVTVALPRYAAFEATGLLLARRLTPLELPGGGETTVYDCQLATGVKLVLFDVPGLDGDVVPTGEPRDDEDAARWGTFARAALALVRQRAEQGAPFDIAHLHGWRAGLFALVDAERPPVVLTIHGAVEQGRFSGSADAFGLGDGARLVLDGGVNVLAAAARASDVVTALGPTHAARLSDPEVSGPFAGVASELEPPIEGITCGIDYSLYNPATDPALESRYDAANPANKGTCKTALVRELDLEVDLDTPLVAALGPLTQQRGSELVTTIAEDVLDARASLVALGPADDTVREVLEAVARRYPDRLAFVDDPDVEATHRLLSAADLLVVTADDTCAAEVLRAQRYGTLPVAWAGGGALDVIVDCDAQLETGTGFLYDGSASVDLLGAVRRAVAAYATPGWPNLVRRVMRLDSSWDRPVRRYLQLYRQAIA